MVCGRIPSRDAVSRSIVSEACIPWSCWSLVTSVNWPRFRNLSINFGSPVGQFIPIRIFHGVLILSTADAVFDCQVLNRLQIKRYPLYIR